MTEGPTMLGTPRRGRSLRRISTFFVVSSAVAVFAGRARAADLDPTSGRLVSVDPGAVMIGFEDSSQLTTLGIVLTQLTPATTGLGAAETVLTGGGTLDSTALAQHWWTTEPAEGAHALLLGSGPTDRATGIMVPFNTLSPLLTKSELEVKVWIRSGGVVPTVTATYGDGAIPADGSFTSVTAIRTGRETSDGWAELSTGPIDTAVWGVPLAQVEIGIAVNDAIAGGFLTILGAAPATPLSTTLLVDALEFIPLDGTPTPPTACTIATQDTVCGVDAECQYGHCLPAYAAWGPTPSQADRTAVVDRWINLAQHVQGARSATKNAASMVAARSALTAASVGGRQFFAGLDTEVNALRNQHTSYGAPASFGLLQPLEYGGTSSTLGACIGVGQLDLLGTSTATDKSLGFIVYRTAPSSLMATSLKVGDAITKIDGLDPLTWVRSVYLTYAYDVPADPGADLAWSAPNVAWMISQRATSLEITRCDSATACTGSHRTVLTIEVAAPAWAELQSTGSLGATTALNAIPCGERFKDTLSTLAPSKNDSSGNPEDVVSTGTIFGDTLGVQFDGTDSDLGDWESEVTPAFRTTAPPTKILFDVRQGNGGYSENADILAEEIRKVSQPIGEVGFYIGAWDGSASEASLLATFRSITPACDLATSTNQLCLGIFASYYLGDYNEQNVGMESVVAMTPAGTNAKVAWLQAADVSANDYLAALVQGRTDQRVFAPGPTSGSFGTISSTSSMLLGWYGGSIQMADSIWAGTSAGFSSQPFRSGTGVAPDEILAQTMTDTLHGVDTMVAAAHAWLESSATTLETPPAATSDETSARGTLR